ncbi:hypothetical protein B566_EDAN004835 [Ephemera danica]|nr:hypothetical protein B566_EDAN004835 [Ephemera danica]
MIVGLCSPLATQNALWVLSELVTEHLTTVLPHASLLMSSDGLLERVESVALEHARKIMDVLTKRKGIVGAVMAIKHIAVDEDELNNSSMMESGVRSRASVAMSDSGSTLSLPAGHRCHAAQDLINLVRASTIMYPEINGFFYDELASMASDQCLDLRFLAWLTDLMVNVFQEEYIVEDEPKEVKMTPQFGLDGEENPIVANIGEQILKAELAFSGRKDSTRGGSSAAVVKPYVICPLFRLVRILKFRTEEGSLEDIDALLGCALQLPAILQNLTRGGLVSIADPLEQRVVLNSLFLTINWFREVINAFAYSREPNVVQKVIQRVRHIVYLENKLAELLPAFPPDYNPPACQFYADVLPLAKLGGKQTKKKKKGRKKKKVAESSVHPALDQSDNELSEPEEEPESEEDMEGQVSDLEPLRACLREMDITLFIMLSMEFKVKLAPTQGAEVTPELGPAELVFFLEDLSTKLEHKLVAGAAQSAPKKGRPAFFQVAATGKVGQPISVATPLHYHLDMFPSEKVARNMAKMTKHMCKKLKMIYSKQLNRCFLLLLRSMRSTIAWNGFYTPQYATLLLVDEDAHRTLLPGVVAAACQFLSNFGEFVLQLPTAIALISLMQVVASHDLNDKSKEAPKNRAAISKHQFVLTRAKE